MNSASSADSSEWKSEKSLVSKAAALLGLERAAAIGARIRVRKGIPLSGGLGGDSSDAAATLKGLDALWRIGLGEDGLKPMAAKLGSDVTFFLAGGTAVAEGRGELIRSLPPLDPVWMVIILANFTAMPGKTGAMYQALTSNHFTDGKITLNMAEAISHGDDLDDSMLFNTFENVAFSAYPGLETVREHVNKMGARGVHLAGSGPTLFCVTESRDEAEDLAARVGGQGLKGIVAETVSS